MQALARDRELQTALKWIITVVELLALVQCAAGQFTHATGYALVSGEVSLARLVDLCSTRLEFSIEYNAAALNKTVTIRQAEALTDKALWRLTNQLLASNGQAVIVPPKADVLQVVPLAEAKQLARVETPESLEASSHWAGYVRVRRSIEHQSVEFLVSALEPILTKPAGSIEPLGKSDRLLISGLKPNVLHALELLEILDHPQRETTVQLLETEHVPATYLAAQINAVVESQNALTHQDLRGKLSATADGTAMVLIAPLHEQAVWTEFVAQFDVRERVLTRSYRPSHFGLAEVKSLIEKTCRQSHSQGSGDQWRIVEDTLTDSLLVTATPAEHQKIEQLINRLNKTPQNRRRPMQAYPIRNRSVTEILAILEQLVEHGALESATDLALYESDVPGATEQISRGRDRSQTSVRSEEKPGAAPSSTSPQPATDSPIRQRDGERRLIELTADEGTNTLIAIGDPRLLEQLGQIINQLDKRQPQVKIEVLVVGLTDSDTFDLGIELRKLEVSGNTLISLASLFGLSTGSLAAGTVSSSGAGFSGVILNPGDFAVVVRALQTINDGRSVTMPHVLVNNNQGGTLNSVLQQPFTSTNASDTVATTSFAGTQDAGTTVTVRPQIAEGDHLVLEYSVAISNFVGDSSAPGIPPPRQQNSLQSIVTIPDGYTIAVGGLEIFTDAEAISQVPWLGDIPGVGEFFKNRSNTRSRSKFYVFIRSTVLRHGGFEDLKYLSSVDVAAAGIDDGWPVVHPRLIR